MLGVPAFVLMASGLFQYLENDYFAWWVIPALYPFAVAVTFSMLSLIGIVPVEDEEKKGKYLEGAGK